MEKIKHSNLVLFSLSTNNYIVNALQQMLNVASGKFELKRFPNMELYIKLYTNVNQCDCIVIGSIAPPEVNLFAFLLLCHTLKKESAQRVIIVLPYFAYSRHDKNEPFKSYAVALLGKLLHSVGIDRIVTIDIHNINIQKLLPMPLVSLSPAKMFADKIIELSLQDSVIVAPDEGAINRCKAVAKYCGVTSDIAYMVKKRSEEGISHSELHGTVGSRALIIDDILDTGNTLISCCERLLKEGVKEIYIMISHGAFTGDKWKKLWDVGVKHIFCTDTIPLSAEHKLNKKITVLSIVPLLINELKNFESIDVKAN